MFPSVFKVADGNNEHLKMVSVRNLFYTFIIRLNKQEGKVSAPAEKESKSNRHKVDQEEIPEPGPPARPPIPQRIIGKCVFSLVNF